MSTDLDAAVARLEERCRHGEMRRVGVVSADVRLLLADWKRLREMTSPAAGLARLEQELGIMDKTIAERDAARAEVERLRAELGQVTGDPESTSNRRVAAAVGELACLRERGAKVSLTLQRGLAGAITQGKRASVRLDWCVHAVKEALELLKETP